MTITDARHELEAALRAAGIRVAPAGGGQLATPAVVVVGADPWIVAKTMGAGRSTVNLELVALVGGSSDPVTMDTLEAMALAIVDAVRDLDWTNAIVHRPGRTDVAGATYTSVRVSMSRLVDTLPEPGAFTADGFASGFYTTDASEADALITRLDRSELVEVS